MRGTPHEKVIRTVLNGFQHLRHNTALIPIAVAEEVGPRQVATASVARIERSEIRGRRCGLDCRTRISLRSIRATRFTDLDAIRRENELLFHLSPEGRGRANKVSEGEGVRKLGILLMRPNPLTPPSPLWGEGVASVALGEIFTSALPFPDIAVADKISLPCRGRPSRASATGGRRRALSLTAPPQQPHAHAVAWEMVQAGCVAASGTQHALAWATRATRSPLRSP
jgi:hypothetical protein